MLCQFFRRRKKDRQESFLNCSLTKQPDDSISVHKRYISNWFSHNLNLMPKDFNYVFSLTDKCLKLCIKPEMNFKTNPPYLPSILRNFNTKIISIQKCYEHNLSELGDICFFRVTVWTLIKQCKEILRIFRRAKLVVCDELSLPRQKLIRVSFLLSHLYHGLVALFPNSYYAPEAFRITKADASEWWHSHFGLSTTVVKWKDFFHTFSKINYVSEVSHIAALKRTINITGSGFVSIFDFDVFVRLFQPWSSILESWRIIALDHPGCMPLLTYEQVVQMLKSFKYCPGPGSYIFRFSCTKPGQWAIGYIDVSGKIFQTIVHNKSLALALCEGEQSGIYRFPNGKLFDSSLVHSLKALPPQSVTVSQEEHEAYCCIDSSFEVCKICELNQKNVRLEPCGHLLCDFCLSKWQKSFRYQGCPFCRFEIKGIERVSLVPFKRASQTIESNSRHCPSVPPRLSSINCQLKLNYAKLDWLSLNDSGYCVYSNYDNNGDGDSEDQVPLEQDLSLLNTKSSSLERSQCHSASVQRHYVNDSVCSTSSVSNNDHSRCIPMKHITDDESEAMNQLLKITGNDVPMSQEILRFFAPRNVAIHT